MLTEGAIFKYHEPSLFGVLEGIQGFRMSFNSCFSFMMAPSGSLQSFDGRAKGRLNGHPKTNMRLQTPGFDVKLRPIKMCNSISMGGSPYLGKPFFPDTVNYCWQVVNMMGPWRQLEYTVFAFCAVSIQWPVNELYFLPKSSLHPRLGFLLLSRLRDGQYTHRRSPVPLWSWGTTSPCSVGDFPVVDVINSGCAHLSGTPVLSSHGQSGHGYMAVQQVICAIMVPSSAM